MAYKPVKKKQNGDNGGKKPPKDKIENPVESKLSELGSQAGYKGGNADFRIRSKNRYPKSNSLTVNVQHKPTGKSFSSRVPLYVKKPKEKKPKYYGPGGTDKGKARSGTTKVGNALKKAFGKQQKSYGRKPNK